MWRQKRKGKNARKKREERENIGIESKKRGSKESKRVKRKTK